MTQTINKIDNENIEVIKSEVVETTTNYNKNVLLRNKADLQVQKDSLDDRETDIDKLLTEFTK